MMTDQEFKSLYRQNFRPLCLYALHYVSDTGVSEDIVQDCFVSFWGKYSAADASSDMASSISILYVAVRNRCIDYLRKRQPDRLEPEDADGIISDDEARERSVDEAALWQAIDRLPKKRRQILMMNKRDGMSYKSIAEETGLSVITVRNHISLAMRDMRKAKIMRQILLAVLMLLFPVISYGQESVLSSMKNIEDRFGYSFVYESSLKKTIGKPGKAAADGETLEKSLAALFDGMPVRWTVRENTRSIILVYDKGAAAPKKRLFTVSGHVTDQVSGETLISAEIVSDGGKGAVTNDYGFYSLTLPEGEHELRCSYLGFDQTSMKIRMSKDTVVNVSLTPSMAVAASVVSARKNAGFNSTYSGSLEVPDNLLRKAPAVLGEPDVMKTLQMLPGIQTGTSFLSGIYVRGGDSDENLILLDGVPVYSVSHLFGALSIFTPEAVKKVSVYKGSFPARYGGRASSIVDIRTDDGNTSRTSGTVSVGLLADKLHLDGPVGKSGKSTYSASLRGMHTFFVDPVLKWAGAGGNYAFYDVNLKWSRRFNDSNRLVLNGYTGRDYMRMSRSEDSGSSGMENSIRYNMRWGNTLLSAVWNHIFSGKLFCNVSLSADGFDVRNKSGRTEYDQGRLWNKTKFRNKSMIRDVSACADFDYTPVPSHRLKFGGGYVHHGYRPEDMHTETDNADNGRHDDVRKGRRITGEELSMYVEDDMEVSDIIRIAPGLRSTLFHVDGRLYGSIEPRLSFSIDAGGGVTLKAAYSRMTQYIHHLVSGNLSLPTDLWVPVTGNIPPVKSDIFSAGATFGGLEGWEFTAEIYWRRLRDVLETKDGKLALSTTSDWEDNVAVGRGRAYGAEFLVQKTVGKFTGLCSYTVSKSERIFPDGTINNGRWFPFANDRRHNIRITAMWNISDNVDAAASWVYMSGNYMTAPEMGTAYVGPDGQVYFRHYVSGRNNYKLAPTHHLDLSVNFTKPKKKGERIWSFGLYNAYCALNPDWTYVNDVEVKDGKIIDLPARITSLSFLTVVPSVSYTYRF